jgi:hypothetical protein
MRHALPDIALAAQRVRAALELSVRRFARLDRYSVGVELRNDAREVVRRTFTAWHDKQRQLIRVRELSVAIDALKIDMMLAKDISAFRSDGEFEAVAGAVRDLGKQCGGWLKELSRKGQSGQGKPPGQRAQILSSRDAPQPGANS